jgi:hypothetical protein
MELLILLLPFLTTGFMFVFKRIAALNLFQNGAAARPWLRTLLIGASLVGTCAFALLTGEPLNIDSVSADLQMILATLANAYLSHAFYKRLAA